METQSAVLVDDCRYPTEIHSSLRTAVPMNESLVEFNSIAWDNFAPGAREKRVTRDNTSLRLLEFSPPFVEHDWCVKSHAGYVVDGRFSVQFRDRKESFVAGEGILLRGGDSNAHKAIVDQLVVLFLVETHVDG
ncbi:hypothetical protein RBSWK_01583 [Rhodopirellula baltica SWK14]|uniref:Uncharacterized protein n=2 Tax=Rhodopirellula baltica TaxID=265606 RepID=L7CLM6_RHOBT|nr:hypothetical protein RBSWK_01583 [Rhodopirellula baltica SWK14]